MRHEMDAYDKGVVLVCQLHGHTYAHALEDAHIINNEDHNLVAWLISALAPNLHDMLYDLELSCCLKISHQLYILFNTTSKGNQS